jgi:hypothetical protein
MNHVPRQSAWLLTALSVCAISASADDLVAIKVTNDNTENIYVSLYDMNTTPPSRLLAHEQINGFASIPISVSADASGNAHVYWTAVTADPTMRKCGRKDKPGLPSDASVHVYAKSDCPSK